MSVISFEGPHRAFSGRLVVTPRELSCYSSYAVSQSLLGIFAGPAIIHLHSSTFVHLVKFNDHDVL